jgi:hypothetical protein
MGDGRWETGDGLRSWELELVTRDVPSQNKLKQIITTLKNLSHFKTKKEVQKSTTQIWIVLFVKFYAKLNVEIIT